jgi:hypothetical protein
MILKTPTAGPKELDSSSPRQERACTDSTVLSEGIERQFKDRSVRIREMTTENGYGTGQPLCHMSFQL